MRPIEGPLPRWRGTISNTSTTAEALSAVVPRTFRQAADVHEALIGDNNLRPISFLELGIIRSRCVAQVIVPGLGVGTGFLVASGLLLTNHHVIPDAGLATSAQARFGYETDLAGTLMSGTYFSCAPDIFFLTDETLDFTLVSVAGDPGVRFGTIPLARAAVAVGDAVAIIQHPGGQPKQLGLVDNQVAYVDDSVVQYLTDTMPGSSGSPVFDQYWRLVALHHSGGWIPEPTSGSTHFRNEGISFNAILDAWVKYGIAS
jgi:hypothetical protein